MDPQWILVIVLWGGLIAVMIACLIPELKKTPEQRKREAEMARESWKKNREEEKRKRQEVQKNAPAKGCLQSTIEFGFLSMFLMIVVIACIMLLIATGD